MILRTLIATKIKFGSKYFSKNNIKCIKHLNIVESNRNYHGISKIQHRKNIFNCYNLESCCSLKLVEGKYLSRGILDGDVTDLQNKAYENDLKSISQLFPNPRVTLNELSSKVPEKIFEVHYKQTVVTPKGGRTRKAAQASDWICTYAFVWPEKKKFESSALSKKQAAEKSAILALHWLYSNNRIDRKGQPVYDRGKLAEIRSTLNEPLKVEISQHSVESISKIWSQYVEEIRSIYETTHKDAARNSQLTPASLYADSTIDEYDEFSEQDAESDGDITETSEPLSYVHPVYSQYTVKPTQEALERRQRALLKSFKRYEEDILSLPIDEYAEQISTKVKNNSVTVIVGAAGCGKSTRAPVAILNSYGVKMAALVSEPRRVAAIGLAQRVAGEMGEEVGETIGYQVRLHAKPPRPPGGSILYCTSGVLLRRLQTNPGLQGCTHVIIDEAHERDVNTDITLLLLKRALEINPELKIVIMSATLDTDAFTRYFNGCPIVEVPGRTFPVEVTYLEDLTQKYPNINLSQTLEASNKEDGYPNISCSEIVEVIKAVDKNEEEGAILVFLPGWNEIRTVLKQLMEDLGPSNMHLILPVHSRLSTDDQGKMFSKPLPGVRKIVLATNIAETSITIPDVVHVIDSGAHKENRLREGTGMPSLETVWVSQAAAKQRTGRAGRVQPGHCYRLYTREKEMEFASHSTPEILRVPLEQVVLDSKTYAPEEKAETFLSQLPEPPSRKAIDFAVKDLVDLGALTPNQAITNLGRYLSSLRLSARLACFLIHASVIGNVTAAADMVSDVHVFGPQLDSAAQIAEAKRKFHSTSDHYAQHVIQEKFEEKLQKYGWEAMDRWCQTHCLRKDRLKQNQALSNLYLAQLLKCGIIERDPDLEQLNRFSIADELSVFTLLTGCNTLLVTKKVLKTKGKMAITSEVFTSTGDRAHVASSSVNHSVVKQGVQRLLTSTGGMHSTLRRAFVIYKTSVVTPHAALLACRGDVHTNINAETSTTIITLPSHRLQFHAPDRQADLLLKAREMLWSTFQYYYERNTKSLDLERETNVSRFKIRLVKAIGKILVEAEKGSCVESVIDDSSVE